MKVDRAILLGEKAKYTHFGKMGTSRYGGSGYDFFVYGVEGLFNIIIDKRWGQFAQGGRRF